MLSSNSTGWRAVAWILAALTVGAWGGVPTVTPANVATASVSSVRSLAAGAWGGHRLGWGSGWTRQTGPTTNSLHSVAYGANGYVVVGEAGTVLTSLDGANWTPQTTPTTHPLLGVAYGANRYVAVGEAGTVLTSPDGTSWTS